MTRQLFETFSATIVVVAVTAVVSVATDLSHGWYRRNCLDQLITTTIVKSPLNLTIGHKAYQNKTKNGIETFRHYKIEQNRFTQLTPEYHQKLVKMYKYFLIAKICKYQRKFHLFDLMIGRFWMGLFRCKYYVIGITLWWQSIFNATILGGKWSDIVCATDFVSLIKQSVLQKLIRFHDLAAVGLKQRLSNNIFFTIETKHFIGKTKCYCPIKSLW